MSIHYIPNAISNVKEACQGKLNTLYSAGIPKLAQMRLEKELSYLENIHHVSLHDEFEIIRLLAKEARKSMHYLSIMNWDAGSFLVYLLTDSLANPLPPHYYCPKCGHFEQVHTQLYGIDLPSKTCPICENPLRKDGFNFHEEFVWGFKGNKIPNLYMRCSPEFFPFAQKVLEKSYPHNQIVPLGTLTRDNKQEKVKMIQSGFFILPNETTIDDYPHLQGYLEDGTLCMSDDWYDSQLFRIDLIPHQGIQYLETLQQKTALYISDILQENLEALTWNDIRNTGIPEEDEADLLYNLKPKSFYEMANTDALLQNSYSKDETRSSLFDINLAALHQSPEFQKYPCYTRDDFIEYLQKNGLDHETSFWLTENIRKGRQPKSDDTSEHRKMLYQQLISLSPEFQTVINRQKYTVCRSQAVQNILLYAKLAYYQKKNSKLYSNIIFHSK